MARRKYAKEVKENEITKEINYIDDVIKLTGYSEEVVKSVIEAFKLSLFEEIADVSTSSCTLPEELTIKLPSIGELVISRLFEGRTDSLMYDLKPTDEFHESTKKAFYTGETDVNNLIANKITEKYLKEYENILDGGNSL